VCELLSFGGALIASYRVIGEVFCTMALRADPDDVEVVFLLVAVVVMGL
jgi:hypothetical protein